MPDKNTQSHDNSSAESTLLLAYPNDIKMAGWTTRLAKYNLTTSLFRSPWLYLTEVFRALFSRAPRKQTTILVHRYIGDYPSFCKAWAAFLFTSALCLASRFPGFYLFWFLHNIDKDTQIFHPRLNKMRRRLLSRFSYRIFVLDPLLLQHAKAHIPSPYHDKLRWTCFGHYAPTTHGKTKHQNNTDPQFVRALELFSHERYRQTTAEGKHRLIGLCLTNIADKYQHIHLAPRLIQEANAATDFSVSLIIAGPFSHTSGLDSSVIRALKNNPHIFLWPQEVAFNENEMRSHFDFIWRINDDLSVPLTAYVAATCDAPILTLRKGFLPELVDRYKLGAVLNTDFSNLEDALKQINGFSTLSLKENFLSSRNWDVAADQIWHEIRNCA